MDSKYLNELSSSLPGGKRAPLYRRKRTNTIPYDKFFENEVKRFSSSESNFAKQSKILGGLDVYIRADFFIFANKATEQSGKGYLLQLWSSLLQTLDAVPVSKKGVWYEYIVILMNRYEFDLIHVSKNAPESHEPNRKDSEDTSAQTQNTDIRILKLYHKNIIRTLKYVLVQMSGVASAGKSSLMSPGSRQFFVKVLATCFFRVPLISGALIDAASVNINSQSRASSSSESVEEGASLTSGIEPAVEGSTVDSGTLVIPSSVSQLETNSTEKNNMHSPRNGQHIVDESQIALSTLRLHDTNLPENTSVNTLTISTNPPQETKESSERTLSGTPQALSPVAFGRQNSGDSSHLSSPKPSPPLSPSSNAPSPNPSLPASPSHSGSSARKKNWRDFQLDLRPLSSHAALLSTAHTNGQIVNTSSSTTAGLDTENSRKAAIKVAASGSSINSASSSTNGVTLAPDENNPTHNLGGQGALTSSKPATSMDTTSEMNTNVSTDKVLSSSIPNDGRDATAMQSPSKSAGVPMPLNISSAFELSNEFRTRPSPSSLISSVCALNALGNMAADWREQLLQDLKTLSEEQSLADKAAVSQSTWFFDFNPSLFQWATYQQKEDSSLLDLPLVPPTLDSNSLESSKSVQNTASATSGTDDNTLTSSKPSNLAINGSTSPKGIFSLAASHLQDVPFFFDFFYSFVSHVAHTAHGEVRWSLVPGYWPLLSIFVKRLLNCSPPYSSPVPACLGLLLQNQELLTFFVRCVLRTTRVSDKMAVNQVLDMLDTWFSDFGNKQQGSIHASAASLQIPSPYLGQSTSTPATSAFGSDLFMGPQNKSDNNRERPTVIFLNGDDSGFPYNFSFGDLICAIDMLLASEHFQILLKTLWFMYTHAGRFTGSQRRALFGDMFISKYFFKLFLHWCPEVRRIFHYILTYKITRAGRRRSWSRGSSVQSSASSTPISRNRGHSIDKQRLVTQLQLLAAARQAQSHGQTMSSTLVPRPVGSPDPLTGSPRQNELEYGDSSSSTTGGDAQKSADRSTDNGVIARPMAGSTNGESTTSMPLPAQVGLFGAFGLVDSIKGTLLGKMTSKVTNTLTNTLSFFLSSSQATELSGAKDLAHPSDSAQVLGTMHPNDPRLEVCTEIVTVLSPADEELDTNLLQKLQANLYLLTELSRQPRSTTQFLSPLQSSEHPLLRKHHYKHSCRSNNLPQNPPIPHSTSAPLDIQNNARGSPIHSPTDPHTPAKDKPVSSNRLQNAHSRSYTDLVAADSSPRPQSIMSSPPAKDSRPVWHIRTSGSPGISYSPKTWKSVAGPQTPSSAFSPSPGPSSGRVIDVGHVSSRTQNAIDTRESKSVTDFCALARSLGVTSDMIPYINASLREYDAHVETQRRLQWFAKNGGVVTPDLFFEIVPNQNDDV